MEFFKNVSQQVGPGLQVSQLSRGLAIGDLFRDGGREGGSQNPLDKLPT